MPYANNKGADQPAHPRSPISTFVVRSLDSIMPAVATVKLLNSDAQKICYNHPKIWARWLYQRVMHPKDAAGIANSVDPDQTAPLGAVWSGSALFAQTYLSENLGSLPGMYEISSLASFHSWAGWFKSFLVANLQRQVFSSRCSNGQMCLLRKKLEWLTFNPHLVLRKYRPHHQTHVNLFLKISCAFNLGLFQKKNMEVFDGTLFYSNPPIRFN